jgi:DtxR family Mn-dependent transcriptional regulator
MAQVKPGRAANNSENPIDTGLGRAPLSAAVEDYLKTIYTLRHEGDEPVVTTQALANRLNVAAPSATAMVKKLAGMKLARHTPYRGVELTEAGEKIALEIIRHHRLLETYLSQVLGLEWDKVHEEADRLEHVLSEEVEARMAAALGHPLRDPHGSPIPTVEGIIARHDETRLSDAQTGELLTVSRVFDEDPELLRHLSDVGLRPEAEVEVLRAVPAEGVLQLRVNGESKILGTHPARSVFVCTRK